MVDSQEPKKFPRVLVYGTFGTACGLALFVALAIPDSLDAAEAQIAATYLALLIGSNKAFNANPLCGVRWLGAVAAFVGTGLLPATIIHVALAGIEPGQTNHLGTLVGYAIVLAFGAAVALMCSGPAIHLWEKYGDRTSSSDEHPSSVIQGGTAMDLVKFLRTLPLPGDKVRIGNQAQHQEWRGRTGTLVRYVMVMVEIDGEERQVSLNQIELLHDE